MTKTTEKRNAQKATTPRFAAANEIKLDGIDDAKKLMTVNIFHANTAGTFQKQCLYSWTGEAATLKVTAIFTNTEEIGKSTDK